MTVMRRLTTIVPTRRLAIVVALVAPLWILSDTRGGLAVAVVASVLLVAIAVGATLFEMLTDADKERALFLDRLGRVL